MTDATPETDGSEEREGVRRLDPDKLLTGTVQANGMVYVGRDLAGEDVHIAVERADD